MWGPEFASLAATQRGEGGGLLLQSQCWGDRNWRDLGAHQPASLGKSVSSGFRERPCLKNSGGKWSIKTSDICPLLHKLMHALVNIYMHACMYAYKIMDHAIVSAKGLQFEITEIRDPLNPLPPSVPSFDFYSLPSLPLSLLPSFLNIQVAGSDRLFFLLLLSPTVLSNCLLFLHPYSLALNCLLFFQ